MDIRIPRPIINVTLDVPPLLIRGKGTPTTGRIPVVIPIFTKTYMKKVRLMLEASNLENNVAKSINIIDEKNNEIGELRSGVYSTHFGKVIGIAMMTKPYWNNSQSFKIELNNKSFDGKVCDLPFI